jgi:putative PIN family toxin of toxin-antitoxin system
MLRVILDSNIHFSSIVFGGLPRQVALYCQPPRAIQLISEPILIELHRVLASRVPAMRLDSEIARLWDTCEQISPVKQVQICRDPDDNRILECAVEGQADFIVTGDKDLLVLGHFQNIPILTARQFLDTHIPHRLS